MSDAHPAWVVHQRQRWLRPDWQHWVCHDAHRFMAPDPNSHRSYASRLLEQRRVEEEQTARDDEAKQLYREHLTLRRELADLKLERVWRKLCRKYGYNPNQPRDGRGRWTDAGGGPASAGALGLTAESQSANAVRATGDNPPQSRVRLAGDPRPPLRRIHPDSTYERDPEARRSLDHWRRQTTPSIVESLKPGREEPLKAHPDGRVADGNTRLKVLQERGYNINLLPRVPHRGGGALPALWPWQ